MKAKKPFSHDLGRYRYRYQHYCFHIITLSYITDKTIFLYPTPPADIESLINCIKPNKAVGIPTKILKEFKAELSEQH